MSRSYWLGVAALSAVVVVFISPASFGQKFIAPNGVQVIKDSDDNQKDNNKDKNKDKDKNKQNGQSNQGNNANNQNNQGGGQNNQGGQNNKSGNAGSNASNSNNNNSNNSNKSNGSNGPAHFPPFVQRGKDQRDSDKSDNNASNKNRNDGDKNFRDRNRDRNDDSDNDNRGKFFGPGQPGFSDNPGQNRLKPAPAVVEQGNKRIGFWKGDEWQGSHKMDNWSRVFGHDKQPFSNDWYRDHPRAWKYDNNRSNVWVVATVPGVYQWLGWGNVPQEYRVDYNQQRFDPSQFGEWYPLGVYSLMTGPDDVGTRVLQLAVDRHGRINGNYFDMITDSDHGVSGGIQQQTQRAEWTLDQNPNVRFQANIGRLLQPYGSVSVQLPGGEQRWQFVRLEN